MSVLSGWRKPARFDCSVLLKQVKPCTGWVVPAPTFTTSISGTTMYSLKVPSLVSCFILFPLHVTRVVPSSNTALSSAKLFWNIGQNQKKFKSLNSICVEGRKNWRKETKTEGNRGRKKEERKVKIRLYGLRLGCKYFIYIYLLHRLVSGFRQSLHSPQLRTQVSTTWSPKDNAKSSDMYGACILSQGKA